MTQVLNYSRDGGRRRRWLVWLFVAVGLTAGGIY